MEFLVLPDVHAPIRSGWRQMQIPGINRGCENFKISIGQRIGSRSDAAISCLLGQPQYRDCFQTISS